MDRFFFFAGKFQHLGDVLRFRHNVNEIAPFESIITCRNDRPRAASDRNGAECDVLIILVDLSKLLIYDWALRIEANSKQLHFSLFKFQHVGGGRSLDNPYDLFSSNPFGIDGEVDSPLLR